MIRKATRKLKFLSLQSRVGSYAQFKKIKLFHKLTAGILAQNQEKLRPYYEQYVREVSRADMAASLELAAFMYTVCHLNGYKQLLDMGSGLSSFVFRLYARETPGAIVYSVDDDAAWLENTRAYLMRHQLDGQNMYTLDQFLKLNVSGFDCILHDLNFVEVRINYVTAVVRKARPGALIVFDDVHKKDYLLPLLVALKKLKVKAFSIRPVTLDGYGRFSLAALNPS